MTIRDKIVPNLVGRDIGCGMETARIRQKRADCPKLDSVIRKKIPSGMNVRENAHVYADDIDLLLLRSEAKVRTDREYLSIGTLGGGNRFIEIEKD